MKLSLKDFAEWKLIRQYPNVSEGEAAAMSLDEILEHLDMTIKQLRKEYKAEV